MDFEATKNEIVNSMKSILEREIDLLNVSKPDLVLMKPSEYILKEIPNPNKYQKAINVYFHFPKYSIEPKSANMKILNTKIDVYITLKKTINEISKVIDRYEEAFYNAIDKNETLLDCCDVCFINDIEEYFGLEEYQQASPVELIAFKLDLIKYI